MLSQLGYVTQIGLGQLGQADQLRLGQVSQVSYDRIISLDQKENVSKVSLFTLPSFD